MQHSSLSLALACTAALLTSASNAQTEASSDAAQRHTLDALPARIPIHTKPDHATLGPYGRWAAGRNYEASFDHGVTFYPRGEGPTSWRWETESIRLGSRVLLGSDEVVHRAARATPWRYELISRDVVEAYDVLAEGLEQTFVLPRTLGADGDLVVRGRVLSALRAPARSATRDGLVFGAGSPAPVEYGAAVVLDAAGRRRPIDVDCDAGTITLTVPRAWLEDAVYPVTIDPIVRTPFAQISVSYDLAIAHDDESAATLFVREYLGSVSAYVIPDNLSTASAIQVFADVGPSSSYIGGVSASYVGGADRWILAWERRDGNTSSVSVYLHDRGNTTTNSGTTFVVDTSTDPNAPVGNPAVGGQSNAGGGAHALVAYERGEEVLATVIDTAALTMRTPLRLDGPAAGTILQRRHPRVNQYAAGDADPWLVVWQEKDLRFADDFDVDGTLIDRNARLSNTARLGRDAGTDDKILPVIDGQSGRFVVAYTGSGSTSVEAQRLDWAFSQESPTLMPHNVVASNEQGIETEAIAFDDESGSHWVLAWKQRDVSGVPADVLVAARLGFDAQSIERQEIITWIFGVFGVAVTYSRTSDQWPLIYSLGADSVSGWLEGVFFRHPASAQALPYGASCGGSILAPRPLAGTNPYPITLIGAAVNAPAVLLLGPTPRELPLAAIGGGTCSLYVAAPVVIPAATSATGTASVPLLLPSRLGGVPFRGDFYVQWAYADAALNTLGVAGTRGLHAAVR